MLEPQPSDIDFDEIETTSPPMVSQAPPDDASSDGSRDAARRIGFWATGLRAWVLVAIVALSTVAFLFWGGALWRVAPGTSHVARIFGSYAIVVPLVVGALLAGRRLKLQHLLSSVGVIWSAKLLITATSYTFIAPGSATEYAPARTWESGAPAPSTGPSSGPIARAELDGTASIAGRILDSGAPVAEAAVVLGGFESFDPGGSSSDVPFAIHASRYEKASFLASPGDRLLVTNRDGVLHTLRFSRDQRAVANVPVPPGQAARPLALPEPGAYELSCENHASERAVLVVAPREFAALTDSDGRFELRGLPSGEHAVTVFRSRVEPVRRAIQLAPHQISTLSIELR